MAKKETDGKVDLTLLPPNFFDECTTKEPLLKSPIHVVQHLQQFYMRTFDDLHHIKLSIANLYGITHEGNHPNFDFTFEVAKVMEFGAYKKNYGRENWAKGGSFTKLIAACQRHLLKWSVNPLDEETGLNHLAHAMCNICFLQYYQSRPDLVALYDDRTTIFIPPTA